MAPPAVSDDPIDWPLLIRAATPALLTAVLGLALAFSIMPLVGVGSKMFVKGMVSAHLESCLTVLPPSSCNILVMMRISGADTQHCYVTGGSQGLGKAVAIELVKRGAHVTIVARNQGKLDEAQRELRVSRRSCCLLHDITHSFENRDMEAPVKSCRCVTPNLLLCLYSARRNLRARPTKSPSGLWIVAQELSGWQSVRSTDS